MAHPNGDVDSSTRVHGVVVDRRAPFIGMHMTCTQSLLDSVQPDSAALSSGCP